MTMMRTKAEKEEQYGLEEEAKAWAKAKADEKMAMTMKP